MTGIRLEKQANAEWGSLFLQYSEKEYEFPYHIPSGEVFNHDPAFLIRFKCFALVCLTPLISAIRSVYCLALSVFLIISEVYRYLDGQSLSQEAQIAVYENAFDSARALGYGALMTGCGFMGIFTPYEARRDYSAFERNLNRHGDGPHRDKFYLAICFQRLSVIPEDDLDVNQVENKLTNYLARIDAIRAALCACSIHQLLVELRVIPAKT